MYKIIRFMLSREFKDFSLLTIEVLMELQNHIFFAQLVLFKDSFFLHFMHIINQLFILNSRISKKTTFFQEMFNESLYQLLMNYCINLTVYWFYKQFFADMLMQNFSFIVAQFKFSLYLGEMTQIINLLSLADFSKNFLQIL